MASSPQPRRWLQILGSVASALIAVAALVLFLAWMGGAFRHKVAPGEVPADRARVGDRTLVAVVKEREFEFTPVSGSVQPRNRTVVSAQMLAQIKEITVRPGDAVWPGKELVLLDDSRLQAQLGEAQAAVVAVRADQVVREKDYERALKEQKTGTISENDFSRIKGAMEVAKAQVLRAEQAVDQLKVQLTYTRITAASKGVVGDRFADPGSIAAPGMPLLMYYDPAELEFHADVSEALAPAVNAVVEERRPLRVRVETPDIDGEGIVTEVVPQTRPGSRSILVKVVLPPGKKQPLIGMFGRVDVPVPDRDRGKPYREIDRLSVPEAAVQHVGQLDLVDVANPDGTLTRRFVRVGERNARNKRVEILAGLAEGERIALPTQ